MGRSLRVDHVEQYRLPKKLQEQENEKDGRPAASSGSGHAYEGIDFENKYNIHQGMDLFAAPAQDKKNGGSPGGDDESKQKRRMEKLQRKEERQRKRSEKEERRRKREERRDRHEEKKRRKRAREYDRSRDDDSR